MGTLASQMEIGVWVQAPGLGVLAPHAQPKAVLGRNHCVGLGVSSRKKLEILYALSSAFVVGKC